MRCRRTATLPRIPFWHRPASSSPREAPRRRPSSSEAGRPRLGSRVWDDCGSSSATSGQSTRSVGASAECRRKVLPNHEPPNELLRPRPTGSTPPPPVPRGRCIRCRGVDPAAIRSPDPPLLRRSSMRRRDPRCDHEASMCWGAGRVQRQPSAPGGGNRAAGALPLGPQVQRAGKAQGSGGSGWSCAAFLGGPNSGRTESPDAHHSPNTGTESAATTTGLARFPRHGRGELAPDQGLLDERRELHRDEGGSCRSRCTIRLVAAGGEPVPTAHAGVGRSRLRRRPLEPVPHVTRSDRLADCRASRRRRGDRRAS